MSIPITTRLLAATPSAGEATEFLDSENDNALTYKFDDGNGGFIYKVVSGQIVQLEESEALKGSLNDQLDNLTCAVSKGVISMSDYISFTQNFNMFYQSKLDASGNLTQSITSSDPGSPESEISVGILSPTTTSGNAIGLTGAATTAANKPFYLTVDRNGNDGDIAVDLAGAPSGVTINANSFVSSSTGATSTYLNTVKKGTSFLFGDIVIDNTLVAGTYNFSIRFIVGTQTKYASVNLVIS